MKKASILFSITMLLNLSLLYGQLSKEEKVMSQGTHTALVLDIPNTKDKLVEKVWKDYTKDFYDAKSKKDNKTDEWITSEADIAAIGRGTPIDMYATIQEQKKNTQINLWIDLGEGYLNEEAYPDRFQEAQKLLMRFGLEVARASTRELLEEEEKELKKRKRDLEKLQRDNKRDRDQIGSLEKKITQAKKDIKDNERDQKKTERAIEDQDSRISLAVENKDLEQMEEGEKKLKKLRNDQDKLISNLRKYNDTIDSSKDKIRKLEKDIIHNEKEQEEIEKSIKKQKKIVEDIRKKLNEL